MTKRQLATKIFNVMSKIDKDFTGNYGDLSQLKFSFNVKLHSITYYEREDAIKDYPQLKMVNGTALWEEELDRIRDDVYRIFFENGYEHEYIVDYFTSNIAEYKYNELIKEAGFEGRSGGWFVITLSSNVFEYDLTDNDIEWLISDDYSGRYLDSGKSIEYLEHETYNKLKHALANANRLYSILSEIEAEIDSMRKGYQDNYFRENQQEQFAEYMAETEAEEKKQREIKLAKKLAEKNGYIVSKII